MIFNSFKNNEVNYKTSVFIIIISCLIFLFLLNDQQKKSNIFQSQLVEINQEKLLLDFEIQENLSGMKFLEYKNSLAYIKPKTYSFKIHLDTRYTANLFKLIEYRQAIRLLESKKNKLYEQEIQLNKEYQNSNLLNSIPAPTGNNPVIEHSIKFAWIILTFAIILAVIMIPFYLFSKNIELSKKAGGIMKTCLKFIFSIGIAILGSFVVT